MAYGDNTTYGGGSSSQSGYGGTATSGPAGLMGQKYGTEYNVPTASAGMQGTGADPYHAQAANAVGGYQTAGYQYGMPSAGGIQMNAQGANGQPLGYIDPSQSAVGSVGSGQMYQQQMQDAYMNQAKSRLDPQWQQRSSDLETQLQNQGLSRGSEAWNREIGNMGNQRNDAYNQAMQTGILNSGAEAQRMQGMEIAGGNFANQAKQQDFMNKFQSQQGAIDLGNFANNAQNQQFGQNLQGAQLNNAAMTAQQQAAQGWGGLQNQLDTARIGASATGAAAAANQAGMLGAAGISADTQRYLGDQNAALTSRNLQRQERGDTFDQAIRMSQNPYVTNNLATSGQGSTYDPNQGNYGLTSPTQSGVNSGAYINPTAQANQNIGTAEGTMGGAALGLGAGLARTGINYYNQNQQPTNQYGYGAGYNYPGVDPLGLG